MISRSRVLKRDGPIDERPPATILFLFTSDTEVDLRKMRRPDFGSAIRQHIWGQFDNGEAGIRLQMDLLDAHRFTGTFFVDVLAEYWLGEDGALQPVFDEILGRGHDVQLHVHPNPHLRFARDERVRRLSRATIEDDPAAFRAVMELAIELFERRSGRLPVAYRAGAYRIFDSHFPILRDLGIVIDSSINPFKNSRVSPWLRSRTQPFWVDGVLEIPISWRARSNRGVWRVSEFAPDTDDRLQLPGLDQLASAAPATPATVCCIAHSVSFLSRTTAGDGEDIRRWNERWAQLVSTEEYERSRMGAHSALKFFDGASFERATAFSAALQRLASRGDVQAPSCAQIAERYRGAWSSRERPVDPMPAVDLIAGRESMLHTRTYGASYLAHLEAVH